MELATNDKAELKRLLRMVDIICNPDVQVHLKREALPRLSMAIQPQQLRMELKHVFVIQAISKGVVDAAVCLVSQDRSAAGLVCDFLGDFAFYSDTASRAVVKTFSQIVYHFVPQHLMQIRPFISLCANIVATCPAEHQHVVALVGPVFLPIINDPHTTDSLMSSTILLLANLSLTVSHELRDLGVVDALLSLATDPLVPDARKSVAESVIILVRGHERGYEVDQLIERNVVEDYCLPILESALTGGSFRGMYPHLVYSIQLFDVLLQSRRYAETIAKRGEAVPLLLRASQHRDNLAWLQSDNEGRRIALRCLRRLVSFGLWTGDAESASSSATTPAHAAAGHTFINKGLPPLLSDDDVRVRSAAASLWAVLHPEWLLLMRLVGRRLEAEGRLPWQLWQHFIVALVPELAVSG